MKTTNRNVLLFALASLLLLILAYANHFNNGFHFDDMHAIVDNVHIRSLKNIPAFFTDPKMFSSDPSHWGLRSLVTTTLAIDYWLGNGLDPFFFQLSTFIWHIGLCVLLFFTYRVILARAFKAEWAVWMAIAMASLYAIHKVNAETINYIISRSDVLSTFLIVLSFYIFIKWPAKRKYLLYIIPAFIGIFAKETVPVLVILLFFYILLFEKKLAIADLFTAAGFKAMLKVIWQILPLIVVVLIVQLYTLSRIPSIPGISNPAAPYILTQSFVWIRYFIAFFLPVNLSADSDWTVIQNALDERIIVGIIFVVGLVITIIKTSKKEETKPIAFGLIWFAAALLPTSLAPFAEVTNDHRMYFPFIGLTLSVITYAGLLLKRYKPAVKGKRYFTYVFVVFFCILGLHAYGVYKRNKVWRNEDSLWYDVTVKSPANGRGLMNYGLTQMSEGKFVIASYYFKKAKEYLPYYSDLYINMGILDSAFNKPLEAQQNFKTAIAYSPNDFQTYAYYAKFLKNNNRTAEAKPMAEKALVLNPYSVMTLNLLMGIYNKLALWPQLQNTAQRLLAILPDNKNAAVYLNAAKQRTPAIENNDVAYMPGTAADYLGQSLEYYHVGLYQQCIDACNKALKLKPDYADAYNNIGAACNKLKQWDKSIAACKKALQIDPSNKLAIGNLNFAESQIKKR